MRRCGPYSHFSFSGVLGFPSIFSLGVLAICLSRLRHNCRLRWTLKGKEETTRGSNQTARSSRSTKKSAFCSLKYENDSSHTAQVHLSLGKNAERARRVVGPTKQEGSIDACVRLSSELVDALPNRKTESISVAVFQGTGKRGKSVRGEQYLTERHWTRRRRKSAFFLSPAESNTVTHL